MTKDENGKKIINQISLLEESLFDEETLKSLPFQFYNLIAQILKYPNSADKINIPDEVEEYFKNNKPKEAANLFQIYRKLGLANTNSFTRSYLEYLSKRYLASTLNIYEYELRKIPTPAEQKLLEDLKVENVKDNHYLSFNITNYLPLKDNNDIDFEQLQSEEIKSDIANYISTINSIIDVASYLEEGFKKITEREFFPIVLKDEFFSLIDSIAFELLDYFGDKVYKILKSNGEHKSLYTNLLEYYAEHTNPDRRRFSADLDDLQLELDEIIHKKLDSIQVLSRESKNDFYLEIIEVVLSMIQSGLCFPIYYYEVNPRLANPIDEQDYNVKYVIDTKIYDSNLELINLTYESFGIITNPLLSDIIASTTINNKSLYKYFIKYSK